MEAKQGPADAAHNNMHVRELFYYKFWFVGSTLSRYRTALRASTVTGATAIILQVSKDGRPIAAVRSATHKTR